MEGAILKTIATAGGAITDDKRRPNESVGCRGEEEEEQEECSKQVLKEDEEVESAKAEMTVVREENVRLKMLLNKIEKDYKSLQMRFTHIFHPEPKTTIEEPDELVSLSLGIRTPIDHQSAAKINKSDSSSISKSKVEDDDDEHLKLGLNYDSEEAAKLPADLNANQSPENSLTETKEEELAGGETWPPGGNKVNLKTTRSLSGDDDLSQANVKRARVSVRARCETATMNDGCQWRKYGQKIAKGNPCPRAYYRCTVAPTCPVRKQVQRCAEDTSILITTYEGTHNHSLPVSARAMASTTSAAASALLSGSSSNSQSATTTFHGLNLSDNSKTRPFYLPNSTSLPFPTITLDLTASTPTTTTTSDHFNVFSSRFPSTNLSFSPSQTNILPTVWSNGNLNYGTVLPYNKTTVGHLYQPNLPKNLYQLQNSQQVLTETLTKAITSDPSFRAVIAAALSMVSGGSASSGPAQASSTAESVGKHLKWDGQTKIVSSNPLTSNGKGI